MVWVRNGSNSLHDAQKAVQNAERALERAKGRLRRARNNLMATQICVVYLVLEGEQCGPRCRKLEGVTVHRLVCGQTLKVGTETRYRVTDDGRLIFEWFKDGPVGGRWIEKQIPAELPEGSLELGGTVRIYFTGSDAEAKAAAWLREQYQLELSEA